MKNLIIFEDFKNESKPVKPETIQYWENVLKQNSNQNKFELGIIETIKKTGKITIAQNQVINKAIKGNKKPYYTKN